MDISFVIVNFQSRQYLIDCVASIKDKVKDFNFEIIIINNDTEDLAPLQNSAQIINLPENIGFGRACNIGSKAAKGNWLFFLNPDCKLLTNNVATLINKLKESNAGIVAPVLLETNNEIQPWSCGYQTSFLDIIANNFGFIRSKKLWQNQNTKVVDWVSGGAFVISKLFFDEVAGFDENFFLYFEDQDLCLRIKALGRQMIVMPEVKVLHLGGKSQIDSLEQKKQYYAAQDYFFSKHSGKISQLGIELLRYISLFFTK